MANYYRRNEERKTKEMEKKALKKILKKVLILVAIVWTLLGGYILKNTFAESVNLFIKQDNKIYVHQHGNPYNYEAKDKVDAEYNETANKYINESTGLIQKYFIAPEYVKVLVTLFALVPYVFIAILFFETISEIFQFGKYKVSKKFKRA